MYILGPLKCISVEPLYLGDVAIQPISSFKLRGEHIDIMISSGAITLTQSVRKQNSRICCVKLLKRSGVDVNDF
jgi:hypothetical protein